MVSLVFSNSNPFKALEKRGLRNDIEDAFAIEAKQNGLPDTTTSKNTYLLLCQNIAEHYDRPLESIDIAKVIQKHVLAPAYTILNHGDEQLQRSAKSREEIGYTPISSITDDMVSAPLVYAALKYTNDKTPFIQCGLQNALKHSGVCDHIMGSHGQSYGKAYQNDSDTVFLAILKHQTELLNGQLEERLNGQKRKLDMNLQSAIALSYKTYVNLGLSGATTLEQDIITEQEQLLSLSKEAFHNHYNDNAPSPAVDDENIVAFTPRTHE